MVFTHSVTSTLDTSTNAQARLFPRQAHLWLILSPPALRLEPKICEKAFAAGHNCLCCPPLSQHGSDRHVFRLGGGCAFFSWLIWSCQFGALESRPRNGLLPQFIEQSHSPLLGGTHRNVQICRRRARYMDLQDGVHLTHAAPSPLRAGMGPPGLVELVRWWGVTGWTVALVQRLSSVCSLSLLIFAFFLPLTAAGSYFLLTVWPRLVNASLQNLTSSHLSVVFESKHLSQLFYRSFNLKERDRHMAQNWLYFH